MPYLIDFSSRNQPFHWPLNCTHNLERVSLPMRTAMSREPVDQPQPTVKRRFARYRLDLPIVATIEHKNAPTIFILGRCHVLNEGGVSALLTQPLVPGQKVTLCLWNLITVDAVVRDVRGLEHGFEFALASEAQRQEIEQLCDKLADPNF